MGGKDGMFEAVIAQYQQAFAAHGDSAAAMLWPKDRSEYRFRALTSHIHDDEFSILDYGCGLAHLKKYMDARFGSYNYSGADMVPQFIAHDRGRYPSNFYLATSPTDVPGEFDHVVMSGIFNTLWGGNDATHFEMVKDILCAAFAKTRRSLAVDFLSDRVDYKQVGAYHQDIASLLDFVRTKLSPRFTLDHSYMPFVFALIVFKDAAITRPQLVFRDYSPA